MKTCICFVLLLSQMLQPLRSQNLEAKTVLYNGLVGGISGSVGALINKKPQQKWYRVFFRGFLTGTAGGLIVYSGKKMNTLVAQRHNLGWCWASRAVFSAGNSIVENAAANRPFWSGWHYDIGFIRFECMLQNSSVSFRPRLMPSTLGGILFIAAQGRLDAGTSLRSGTLTFRTDQIRYAPRFTASTTSNGFLLNDTLRGNRVFYETYAHEMIHAFQFQELSGCNLFFKPWTDRWGERSATYRKWYKWIYGDMNYEGMLIHYFLIQGGYRSNPYCRNYLENEAEFLSNHRGACDK